MKYSLVNKNVLLLHFFYTELERSRKLNTILKLWKLDHFALFDVNSKAALLIKDFRDWYSLSFGLAELCNCVK